METAGRSRYLSLWDAFNRGICKSFIRAGFQANHSGYTNDRLRAISSGAMVTALLQSSSAVSLMVLAFVGAGVMKLFRKRLVEIYHSMSRILAIEDKEVQYRSLLTSFVQQIKEADKKIKEMEIASILMVNRLFTQSCRMQKYSMKNLLLSQDQINNFDRAMVVK